MNIDKAKVYLEKANLLFKSISSDGKISNIERDLMLSYIRDLYDACIEEGAVVSKSNSSAKTFRKVKSKKEEIAPKPTYTPPVYRKPEPPKPEKKEQLPPAPKYKQEEIVVPPAPKPVVVPPTPKPAPKVVVPPAPKPAPKRVVPPAPVFEVEDKREVPVSPRPTYTPPASTKKFSREIEELFEEQQVQELSQKLSQTPVKDLKVAFGINEKFLIINELFHGDSGAYNSIINELNGYSNFDQAKNYLAVKVVDKMDWTDDKRTKRARDFIQKIRRRYLS